MLEQNTTAAGSSYMSVPPGRCETPGPAWWRPCSDPGAQGGEWSVGGAEGRAGPALAGSPGPDGTSSPHSLT